MSEVVGEARVEISADGSKFGSSLDGAVKGGLGVATKAGTAVGAALVGGLGYAATQFAGFDQQMREVFTLMPGMSQAAMDDMTGQVLDFGREFGKLPQEVVPALYDSLSAGVPADNVFAFLEEAQKFAAAGATDVGTAVDGLTTVVNAFGLDAADAGDAADAMFTAVKLGKCIRIDQRVLTNRGMVPIGELTEGATVYAWDGRGFVASRAHFVPQPDKPTVRVVTRLGREIVTTWSHPYLVARCRHGDNCQRHECKRAEWVPVKDLRVGDRIAVPTHLPFFGDETIGEHKAALLGLWLAEGTSQTDSLRITSTDYGDDIKRWAGAWGCSAHQIEKRHRRAPTYRLSTERGLPNPALTWLKGLGLGDGTAATKHIPGEVFARWDRDSVATLLRWLMNGDGWLSTQQRPGGTAAFQLGFCSKSERLVRDVSHLMLRFGVVGRIRYRPKVDAWVWETTRWDEIRQFVEQVGIDRPNADLVLAHEPQKQRRRTGPIEYDPIVAIEDAGVAPVADLTVPGLANFVAEDIVAHNTTVTELSSSMFQVAPIAAAMGVGVDEVSAAFASLTAQGVPTSVAATQLKGAFSELAKQGSVADKAFRDMAGVGFQQFIDEGGSVQDAFNLLADGAAESGKSVVDLFGSVEAGQAVMGLTGDQADRFAANLAAMGDKAGAVDEAFATMDQGLGPAMNRIKATLMAGALEIGQAIAPVIESALDAVVDFLPIVIEGFQRFLEVAGPALEQVGSAIRDGLATAIEVLVPHLQNMAQVFVAEVLPRLAEFASFIFSEVVPALVDFGQYVLVELVPPITAAFLQLWDALQPALQSLAQVFVEDIMPAAQQLATVFVQDVLPVLTEVAAFIVGELLPPLIELAGWIIGNVVPVLAELVSFIFGSLIPALAEIVTWIAEHIIPVFEGFVGFITGDVVPVFTTIQETVSTVFSAISDTVSTVMDAISTAISETWNAISDTVSTVMDAISTAISETWNAISETISTVIETIQTVITEAWDAIATAVDEAMHAVQTVIEEVWNAITEFIQLELEGIQLIVETVWDAISTAVDEAVHAVQTVIEEVWNAITEFIDTELEGIRVIVETVWEAIRLAVDGAMQAIRGIIDGAWQAIRGIVDGAMSGIQSAINTGLAAVEFVVRGFKDTVIGIFSDALSWLYEAGADIMRGFLNGIKWLFENAIWNFLTSLKTRIVAAIPNPLSILYDIGKKIIEGLWNGMKAVWNQATGWLGGLGGAIKSLKGPIEEDAVLLVDEGRAIIGGLADGMQETWHMRVVPELSAMGPALVDVLAQGLLSGKGNLSSAFDEVLRSMREAGVISADDPWWNEIGASLSNGVESGFSDAWRNEADPALLGALEELYGWGFRVSGEAAPVATDGGAAVATGVATGFATAWNDTGSPALDGVLGDFGIFGVELSGPAADALRSAGDSTIMSMVSGLVDAWQAGGQPALSAALGDLEAWGVNVAELEAMFAAGYGAASSVADGLIAGWESELRPAMGSIMSALSGFVTEQNAAFDLIAESVGARLTELGNSFAGSVVGNLAAADVAELQRLIEQGNAGNVAAVLAQLGITADQLDATGLGPALAGLGVNLGDQTRDFTGAPTVQVTQNNQITGLSPDEVLGELALMQRRLLDDTIGAVGGKV